MSYDKSIHIFYACDENFLKYMAVSLTSLMKNASKAYHYKIHILHTDISEESKKSISFSDHEHFTVVFDDVSSYLMTLKDKLPLRDYYTKTTYFRFFIAEMYPTIKKAVYLDSDTVVLGDISELYATDIGDNYIAATVDQVMVQTDVFGDYVEKAIGIPRNKFFSAGILVINCKRFRHEYVLDQFVDLLKEYRFVVTQDEDYLNVICKGKVKYLHPSWNVQTYGQLACREDEFKLLHYIMVNKPWHYSGGRYEHFFWQYAKETAFYKQLLQEQQNYSDEQKAQDAKGVDRLVEIAKKEVANENNFLNAVVRKNLAPDRIAVLKKIQEYEKEGRFDEDVEDDPPAPQLLPDQIDYLRSDPISGTKTWISRLAGRLFLKNLIKHKKMIVKEIRGIEHFQNLHSGAIITCNHFNPYDSFAIQLAYDAAKQKKRKLYRIIREGNYTNFPGFYGFLMRNCDTLPMSSNNKTMRKFLRANDQLLQKGHFILIYPEQSMWWNYRKPKMLKPGGYSIAAKNNVPVLPCFITMKDSDIMGDNGFYVQEYTIHISEPIYPDPSKGYRENVRTMQEKNYSVWKEIYEKEYGVPLAYETAEEYKDLLPI